MKERIFLEAQRLSRKWDTRDPFELLDMLNVVVERTRHSRAMGSRVSAPSSIGRAMSLSTTGCQ